MGKFFNTAGPCNPDYHYMVDPIARLGDVDTLLRQNSYFVVHAPRQTGKTTSMKAWAEHLRGLGTHIVLYMSCEEAQAVGDDIGAAELLLCRRAAFESSRFLDVADRPQFSEAGVIGSRFGDMLAKWSMAVARPIVLIMDEIDALRGQSLISILRQLRAGYPERPKAFPASILLCGLRDVRDYKAASGGDPDRLGTASPFNVKVESIALEVFDDSDVRTLFGQHETETGQQTTPEALERILELSGGQPWLVNSFGREIVDKMKVPPTNPITIEMVEMAKERLILARETHLDSLVARLSESRVRSVLEPIVSGEAHTTDFDMVYQDNVSYLKDLGLLKRKPPLRVANPIYQEIMLRVLSTGAEERITVDPRTFVLPDGKLDALRLMSEFAEFWKEQGSALAPNMPYSEVSHQLILMAYMQRVVNGGGYISREFGVGRRRIDLLLKWPYSDSKGKRHWQQEAFELKVWRDGRPDPLVEGLSQLDTYLTQCSLDRGHLVLFDRRSQVAEVDVRTRFEQHQSPSGRAITVLRA